MGVLFVSLWFGRRFWASYMLLNSPSASQITHNHPVAMPLYELLCLARPALPKDGLQRMIHKVGGLVYSSGGVVTNVVSYGKQPLAYKIKGVHGKYGEAHIWQLDFALSPEALREVDMQMRINEDVLRYAIVKRNLPKLPNPRELYHRLSEHNELLRPPPKPGQAQLLPTSPN